MELNRLKENHKKELENTKSNLTDIYEKQIEFLKQSQDESRATYKQMKTELEEKKVTFFKVKFLYVSSQYMIL